MPEVYDIVGLIMAGNYTCENTINEFLPFSTFNWCHRYSYTSVKTTAFYINNFNIRFQHHIWQLSHWKSRVEFILNSGLKRHYLKLKMYFIIIFIIARQVKH